MEEMYTTRRIECVSTAASRLRTPTSSTADGVFADFQARVGKAVVPVHMMSEATPRRAARRCGGEAVAVEGR